MEASDQTPPEGTEAQTHDPQDDPQPGTTEKPDQDPLGTQGADEVREGGGDVPPPAGADEGQDGESQGDGDSQDGEG
jgi:hypothetical protein